MVAITKPANHFQVVTSTGAGIKAACEAVFGDGLYVIKDRANANNWQWIDYVRGTSNVLQSNTTAAETTYTAPTGSSVGFCWKAGGAAVTNTAGSITSQVSANTTAGFSIVTYTGTGVNATVGHGLGVALKMVIVKNRSLAATRWNVWHSRLSDGNSALYLDGTEGQQSNTAFWNNTVPSSTTFSVGTGANGNGNSNNIVAYCFAEVPGFSKFGSYTGNGSSDGPFVFCGFRPRWIMAKRTDTGGTNWQLIDTARDTFNNLADILAPNSSAAELVDYLTVNVLANGFKVGNTDTSWNASGGTYIFAAFAENPFGGSNVAPATAR